MPLHLVEKSVRVFLQENSSVDIHLTHCYDGLSPYPREIHLDLPKVTATYEIQITIMCDLPAIKESLCGGLNYG